MHGTAWLVLHWFGHEGAWTSWSSAACRTVRLNRKSGQQEKGLAVIEIDLHLCGAGFMTEGIDIELLDITIIVNILEQRIKFVHRIYPKSLSCQFARPERPTGGDNGVLDSVSRRTRKNSSSGAIIGFRLSASKHLMTFFST